MRGLHVILLGVLRIVPSHQVKLPLVLVCAIEIPSFFQTNTNAQTSKWFIYEAATFRRVFKMTALIYELRITPLIYV